MLFRYSGMVQIGAVALIEMLRKSIIKKIGIKSERSLNLQHNLLASNQFNPDFYLYKFS